jgi:hypothetical protein
MKRPTEGGLLDFEMQFTSCDRDTARANVAQLLGDKQLFAFGQQTEAIYQYHDANGIVTKFCPRAFTLSLTMSLCSLARIAGQYGTSATPGQRSQRAPEFQVCCFTICDVPRRAISGAQAWRSTSSCRSADGELAARLTDARSSRRTTSRRRFASWRLITSSSETVATNRHDQSRISHELNHVPTRVANGRLLNLRCVRTFRLGRDGGTGRRSGLKIR